MDVDLGVDVDVDVDVVDADVCGAARGAMNANDRFDNQCVARANSGVRPAWHVEAFILLRRNVNVCVCVHVLCPLMSVGLAAEWFAPVGLHALGINMHVVRVFVSFPLTTHCGNCPVEGHLQSVVCDACCSSMHNLQ